MTYNKRILIVISSLVLLCACESTAEPNSSIIESALNDETAIKASEFPEEIIDICGNSIVLSEENRIDNYFYSFDFIYLFLSDGTVINSVDSPDEFLSGISIDYNIAEPEYFKAEKGYTTSGITLVKSESFYNGFDNSPCYSYAAFNGEITLKGYITINTEKDSHRRNQIYFMPADREWKDFPLPFSAVKGDFRSSNIRLRGNAPRFMLGYIDDYTIDVSAIPTDGTATMVEVTLSDISLSWADSNWGTYDNTATLVKIKTFEN